MKPEPSGAADLERLEADVEEALIALIDRPADNSMIADLQRRKLHLIDEIKRLRCQFGVDVRSAGSH
jgi:hypothetical protein